jgi:hypothetical protein
MIVSFDIVAIMRARAHRKYHSTLRWRDMLPPSVVAGVAANGHAFRDMD